MKTLDCPWRAAGLGLMLLLGLTGFNTPNSIPDFHAAVPQDAPLREIVQVEHDKTDGSAQLLVPDFLQGRESKKFGYFVYLIFAEQTRRTYNKRLAAAEAFMCQRSTLSQALELGLSQSDLALFGAPVKKGTNTTRLNRLGSAGTLLKEYHYRGAHFLLRQLRVRNTSSNERFDFTIGIIGSPVPLLTSMAEVDPDTVQVLKLDQKSSYQIGKTIGVFRKGLNIGHKGKNGSSENSEIDLATRMQKHFLAVKSKRFPIRPETGEPEDVCR